MGVKLSKLQEQVQASLDALKQKREQAAVSKQAAEDFETFQNTYKGPEKVIRATDIEHQEGFVNDAYTQAGETNAFGRELANQSIQAFNANEQAAGETAAALNRFDPRTANLGLLQGQRNLDQTQRIAAGIAAGARGNELSAFNQALTTQQQAGLQSAADAQTISGQQTAAEDQARLAGMFSAGSLQGSLAQQQAALLNNSMKAQQQATAGVGQLGLSLGGAIQDRELNFAALKANAAAQELQRKTNEEIARSQRQQNKSNSIFKAGTSLIGGAGSVLGAGLKGGK